MRIETPVLSNKSQTFQPLHPWAPLLKPFANIQYTYTLGKLNRNYKLEIILDFTTGASEPCVWVYTYPASENVWSPPAGSIFGPAITVSCPGETPQPPDSGATFWQSGWPTAPGSGQCACSFAPMAPTQIRKAPLLAGNAADAALVDISIGAMVFMRMRKCSFVASGKRLCAVSGHQLLHVAERSDTLMFPGMDGETGESCYNFQLKSLFVKSMLDALFLSTHTLHLLYNVIYLIYVCDNKSWISVQLILGITPILYSRYVSSLIHEA